MDSAWRSRAVSGVTGHIKQKGRIMSSPNTQRHGISAMIGVWAITAGALAGGAAAQTGFSISGALSNFDCTNRCDYSCDEMEIDIEGAQPSDIIHTYANPNYGTPTVTLSADGTYTVVDYRNTQH